MSEEIAKKIGACFDDVDWTKQKITCNGQKVNIDGETKFYKSTEIDEAIEKLNKLIDELKEPFDEEAFLKNHICEISRAMDDTCLICGKQIS